MMHDLWDSQIVDQMRDSFRRHWQQQLVKHGAPEVPANFRFEIYRDTVVGLNEIVRGLLEFFPHKRTVAYVSGTTPKIASFLPGLSRDGVTTKEIPLRLAQKDPSAAFALCDDDTLMVIAGEVDPLTGEIFSLREFQNMLAAKKIFSVELYPSLKSVSFATASSPYRAQLISLNSRLAIAVLGSRAKGPALLMGTPFYGTQDQSLLESEFASLAAPASDAVLAPSVRDLESARPAGGHAFFPKDAKRLNDRAVLVWEDLDGFAICELLCEKNNWNIHEFIGIHLDTASGCRWSEWNFTTWLTEQQIDSQDQRGLVIFTGQALASPVQLVQQLTEVCEELRRLQG